MYKLAYTAYEIVVMHNTYVDYIKDERYPKSNVLYFIHLHYTFDINFSHMLHYKKTITQTKNKINYKNFFSKC